MKNEDFKKVVEQRIEKIKAVLGKKGAEYTRGGDRFSNFKRAAAVRGNQTPEDALLGMMMKHIVSIIDLIEDMQDSTETVASYDIWSEKIGDSINYLILLEGMIIERRGLSGLLNEIDESPDKNTIYTDGGIFMDRREKSI